VEMDQVYGCPHHNSPVSTIGPLGQLWLAHWMWLAEAISLSGPLAQCSLFFPCE
jgi:hypothetical protein